MRVRILCDMEQEVDGLEAEEGSDIEIPTDADMFTIIYHFNADEPSRARQR